MSTVPNFSQTLLAAAGAITILPPSATYSFTAAGAIAMTLAAPAADGVVLTFIDEGGHAHTITATGLVNGAHNVLTFNGTVGSAVELKSRNGNWFSVVLNGVAVS